ncbi:MAG TPA: hypothetical protein VLX44_10745 [Xanthobacteraceae bacterium]|nr:hypothetical protein [Xanthobacteraceae bacterium]
MTESDGVTAPVEPASETAQAPASLPPPSPMSSPAASPTASPTWRLGPIAVASGLAVSVLIHLALVGTVLVVSPLVGRPAPVYSVPVELVTPDEVPADKPADKPDEADKSTKPGQSDQSTQTAQADPQPQSAGALPLPPPSLPLDAFALPLPPPSREAAAPPPPSGQAEQLAKLIGLPTAGPSGGGPSDVKANLTNDQIAAFASHLQSCWTSPPNAGDDPKIYVVIRVSLRRDGSLAAAPEVVAGSASVSALAIKQSAMKALQHCPAYSDLPADKYDEWRLLDLRFTPSGISAATPVTGGQRPRPG